MHSVPVCTDFFRTVLTQKGGPLTGGIGGATCELVRNAGSWATVRPTESESQAQGTETGSPDELWAR